MNLGEVSADAEAKKVYDLLEDPHFEFINIRTMWWYKSTIFASAREKKRPDRDCGEQNALYRDDGIANQMSPRNLFESHIYINKGLTFLLNTALV